MLYSFNAIPYDKALGTFFMRCRIKIPHQPFPSYLLILLSFLVLSPIFGNMLYFFKIWKKSSQDLKP
ncbi:MAG TPA: hypothetical protein HPP56_01010 [Nitrospirae bacterium]|nr:hypothetical protein [Nitrospirota bacterium]